jgi:hypothetical protein
MWPFNLGKAKGQINDVNEHIKQETQPLNEAPKQKFITLFNQISTKKYNSESLLQLAEGVSQLSSVINYIANKSDDIPIRHVKLIGNGKYKDLGETELLKEIKKIKATDVIQQLIINGNAYIKKSNTPGFKYPTSFEILHSPAMYNIPERALDIYGTPVLDIPHYDNPLICYRQKMETGNLKRIELEEIILIKDNNPRKKGANYYYGSSRTYAATQSLLVLKNLYETINTILSAKGALGFLSRTSKTGEMDPMMWKDVIEELEDKINYGYGTTEGRKAIMATFADAKWNKMDSPIHDYLPVELSAHEFAQLCNQLGGIPDIIFNSKGNTTYNNYETALKVFYINCLQPLMTNIYTTISNDLGLDKSNELLMPDYSDVECLKPDEKAEADAQNAEYEYYTKLYDNNIITLNQYLEEIGEQTRLGGDIFKSDMPTTITPLAITLGVGGTQSLQLILADPNISSESKVSILQILFGISESDSKRMVSNTVNNGN